MKSRGALAVGWNIVCGSAGSSRTMTNNHANSSGKLYYSQGHIQLHMHPWKNVVLSQIFLALFVHFDSRASCDVVVCCNV